MAGKFTHRSTQKEIMDDFNGAGEEMSQTLRELDAVNRLLGGNNISIDGLKILLENKPKGQPIKIADLGCGGGDIMAVMAKWARKNNITLVLEGIDANPHIIDYAKKNTAGFPEISYHAINIFSEEFRKREYDIIHSSLFTHHFTDEELIQLLSQIKSQARMGIIINDLQRNRFAYYAIKYITAIFSRSPMVQNDGPISVLRSFHKKDWEQILIKSGVGQYRIRWKWAFRWQVLVQTSQLSLNLEE